MNFAFAISPDDVVSVLQLRFGREIPLDGEVADELFGKLDEGAVEKSALRGDDVEDQTEGAFDEIERQLRADPGAMLLIEAAPVI